VCVIRTTLFISQYKTILLFTILEGSNFPNELSNRILYYTPFKKYLLFDKPIRKGVCKRCGKKKGQIKKTNLHHFKYDDSNKLAHTIEVCQKCHAELDPKLRHILRKNKVTGFDEYYRRICPTCGTLGMFIVNCKLRNFRYYRRQTYRMYKEYSYGNILIQPQKCPTCSRIRLFKPNGSLSKQEYLDGKEQRKTKRKRRKKIEKKDFVQMNKVVIQEQ